jgi:hypothetical protein
LRLLLVEETMLIAEIVLKDLLFGHEVFLLYVFGCLAEDVGPFGVSFLDVRVGV